MKENSNKIITPKILIYGYGNPGRQDDGLGIALVDMIEKWIKSENIENIYTDSNYQLNIEDSFEISKYDIIIFADASEENIDDFAITQVKPSEKTDFSMHSVSPALVIYLCNKLYSKFPLAFLLHIKGYKFNYEEEMTEKANFNLNKAYNFLIKNLKSGYFFNNLK